MALAAYNAGPGRISRALARSGGAKTYWDIYYDLNAETRGYVPKFIAAAYAYTYHEAHGVVPAPTPDCVATDTVMVSRVMHLGQVASTLNIPIETLRDLNPQYKLDIIPATKKSYSLRLPTRYTSEFVQNEKEIHSKDSLYLKEYINPANLEKKRAIVERLAAINPEEVEGDLRTLLRSAQEEWNAIGHVPFKEKDVVYKALREQMDRLYGALSASAAQRRINRFKNEVNDTDGKVRERLVRQFDILKNEIKTYENNLGFLTLSSKSGNGLVDELNRKVEKLKADLVEIKAKIAALDEKKQGN